jgi:tetratricopeptide (TPR) repeat protein
LLEMFPDRTSHKVHLLDIRLMLRVRINELIGLMVLFTTAYINGVEVSPAWGGTVKATRIKVAVHSFSGPEVGSAGQPLGDAFAGSLIARLREFSPIQIAPGLDTINYIRLEKEWEAKRRKNPVESSKGVWAPDADWIITGTFEHRDSRWRVKFKAVENTGGRQSIEKESPWRDWNEVHRWLIQQVLEAVGVKVTGEDEKRIAQPWLSSAEVANRFFEAVYLWNNGGGGQDFEYSIGEVLNLEPGLVEARCFLAAKLDGMGRTKEAEDVAREALKMKPGFAQAKVILAVAQWHRLAYSNSIALLQEAALSDPSDAAIFCYLGQLYRLRNEPALAAQSLEHAVELQPDSARWHAELALIYAKPAAQDRDLAMYHLKKAQGLLDGLNSDGVEAAQTMCLALISLRQDKLALEQYQTLVTFFRKWEASGAGQPVMNWIKAKVYETRTYLPPYFLTEQISNETGSRLENIKTNFPNFDLSALTNPLAATLEMQQWAQSLTRANGDDESRARALFTILQSRQCENRYVFEFERPQSAEGVFKGWSRSQNNFRCQELTYLYVALARTLGLRAYFTFVEQDVEGNRDFHACPALVTPKGVLLADPAFWFGVPHKRYKILNDVETMALALSDSDGLDSVKAACVLAPQLPIVYEHLFERLRSKGDWAGAGSAVSKMEALDPDGAFTLYARSVISARNNDLDTAVRLLTMAVERAPDRDLLWVQLGDTYQSQGNTKDAEASYRRALRCAATERSKVEVESRLEDSQRPVTMEKESLKRATNIQISF